MKIGDCLILIFIGWLIVFLSFIPLIELRVWLTTLIN